MAKLLTGAQPAAAIKEDLKGRVAELSARGIVPCLGVLRVGEDGGQISYERGLRKTLEALGIRVESVTLPEGSGRPAVYEAIRRLNADSAIHGVLILRPLPGGLEDQALLDVLSPEKDVDGATSGSLAMLLSGRGPGWLPCTPEAVLRLLDHYGVPLAGARVVVVGRSLVVGKPLSLLLIGRDATVTLCHRRTRDLPEICRSADILVCAAGQAGLIREDYVNQNQVVVDVAANLDADGKLSGDADFAAVEPLVAAITPVPRGVGTVTSSVLAAHVVRAAEGRDSIE